MNRQWLDERMAQPHTLERQRVTALAPWVRQADWLLDLHSMHESGAPLLLTGVQPRNLALARALANPVHIVVDAGHKDGVRMRDYGRFGLPDAQAPDTRSLLIECGFHGDLGSRDVARDMCARFLQVSGVVDAASMHSALPGWQQADAPQQWALEVTGPVVARSEQFQFTEPFTGLECIAQAGTVIGDNDGEPVTTPYDDCVLVMPSVRQARAGVTVVRFARRRPLA
jgi:predicted deacylase